MIAKTLRAGKSHSHQDSWETNHGAVPENDIPQKMPVINEAAANIPAVAACCGSTIDGAYIIANELKYPELKLITIAIVQYTQSLVIRIGIERVIPKGW